MSDDSDLMTPEQAIKAYIQSIKEIDNAIEPFKEQRKELKQEFIDNQWLTKEDISLAMKAYSLSKNDGFDIEEFVDMYRKVKRVTG